MSEGRLLFTEVDLRNFLTGQLRTLIAEIDAFDSDYVLKVNHDDLVAHLSDEHQLVPIEIFPDKTQIGDHGDTKVDVTGDARYDLFNTGGRVYVPGTFAEFIVPFAGDSVLFRFAPSTRSYNPPRATIMDNELRFRFVRTDHDEKAMRREFDNEIENTLRYIAWSNADVEAYNRELPQKIRQRLNHRKEKFLKDRGLVERLGFPIRPRNGAQQTYAAPITRKKLPIQRPTMTPGAFEPEPVLESDHYEHILQVISNMVMVMERSPQAFVKMDEPDLRTHILVQLNGQYEGQATGETFNYEGKTDILIRVDGRNIFIAECKVWKGAAAFTSTIDQLLGYAAWRDTKTAIILFNRNKNLSEVLNQIPELVKHHANFKREIRVADDETKSRYILHQRDDKKSRTHTDRCRLRHSTGIRAAI